MRSVFLSYRHESDAHREAVRSLALKLREAGLGVILDLFANAEEFSFGGPDEGWATWCKRQAREVDRVLIIASASWFACYLKQQEPGVGLGAAAEAHVLDERLYLNGQVLNFGRIVYFDQAGLDSIPTGLKTFPNFSAAKDFSNIISWLGGKIAGAGDGDGWLPAPPNLEWPLADCEPVRRAFAGMLATGSAVRVLLIKGVGQVGKTRLTNHLHALGVGQPNLACGRFDLRGVADLDLEFGSFAATLGIEDDLSATAGEAIRQRLEKLLTALRKRARPALLIFDTFDGPSEVADWIEKRALLVVVSAPWLRLVIAGRRPPTARDTVWAKFAAPTVTLEHLPVEEWVSYAKRNRPDLEERFVRQLYEVAGGNHAMLDQLLGPKTS